MILNYFKRMLLVNRDLILHEILEVKGLMHLLMKPHEGKDRWTCAEKKEIMLHLKNLSGVVPALVIFMLPAGSLLLPFLIEMLDRRNAKRQ